MEVEVPALFRRRGSDLRPTVFEDVEFNELEFGEFVDELEISARTSAPFRADYVKEVVLPVK